MDAIDLWHGYVIDGKSLERELYTQLQREIPPMLSWIVRGGCAVQCQHCIFPFEGPKAYLENPGTETMLSLLGQLKKGGTLVHEGRQLLPSQVPTLAAIKRAGHNVSLINNGQYVTPAMLSLIEREGLLVDALDVSVDGTENIHNVQRTSSQAWEWAMKGLKHGRRILTPQGRLTSLYTLTPLNCSAVREVGQTLAPIVDEWHLTTMSLRPGIRHMRANKQELDSALKQLFRSRWEKPVFLRTYSLEDFVLILEIIGEKAVRKAFKKVRVGYNSIVLDLEGIPFYYYPKSLAVNETLVVDADGWWRFAYCIHYTLDELRAGRDRQGRDISHFSVMPVYKELDLRAQYGRAARTWWHTIGGNCLNRERTAIRQFF
jgi:hypothetical protein